MVELGEHKVYQFFFQICLALETIHDQGIVHADLKPSNLLMSGREYTLKLTDFGVSIKFYEPPGVILTTCKASNSFLMSFTD